MQAARVSLAVLVGLGGTLVAAHSNAKTCGGVTDCQCGDRLVSSRTFVSGVDFTSPCTGSTTALFVLSSTDIELDCAGVAIVGPGTSNAGVGIGVNGSTNITIRNCDVSRFTTNIWVGGSSYVELNNNWVRARQNTIDNIFFTQCGNIYVYENNSQAYRQQLSSFAHLTTSTVGLIQVYGNYFYGAGGVYPQPGYGLNLQTTTEIDLWDNTFEFGELGNSAAIKIAGASNVSNIERQHFLMVYWNDIAYEYQGTPNVTTVDNEMLLGGREISRADYPSHIHDGYDKGYGPGYILY